VSPPLSSQSDTGDRSFVRKVHPVYYSTQISESFGAVSRDLYETSKNSQENLNQSTLFSALESKQTLLEYAKHVKSQVPRQLSRS